jgi:hypothetical protein
VTFDAELMLPMLILRIDEGDDRQYEKLCHRPLQFGWSTWATSLTGHFKLAI